MDLVLVGDGHAWCISFQVLLHLALKDDLLELVAIDVLFLNQHSSHLHTGRARRCTSLQGGMCMLRWLFQAHAAVL